MHAFSVVVFAATRLRRVVRVFLLLRGWLVVPLFAGTTEEEERRRGVGAVDLVCLFLVCACGFSHQGFRGGIFFWFLFLNEGAAFDVLSFS